MRKVLSFSLFLMLGLVASQLLPGALGTAYPGFKATSDTVFYEAIIPAQKAGSTVYWLIVVTNENGLSSVTEAQQYSVYAI